MRTSTTFLFLVLILFLSSCSSSHWLSSQRNVESEGALTYSQEIQTPPAENPAIRTEKSQALTGHKIKKGKALRLIANAKKFQKSILRSGFEQLTPSSSAAGHTKNDSPVFKIIVVVIVLILIAALLGGGLGRLLDLLISILIAILLIYLILWLLGII